MRYGKFFICILTAALIAFAVYLGIQEREMGQPSDPGSMLSVRLSSGETAEEIACWRNESGGFYAFLPSYAELSNMTLRLHANAPISIDGQPVSDGMGCESYQWDTEYSLSYFLDGEEQQGTLTFLRSENMPAIYMDTASGSMDYIHEVKGNRESGNLRLYRENGELANAVQVDSIRGRGNSTWLTEKKPYSLKLTEETELLNMGASKKWLLLTNTYDPSNLRNKVIYDFAGKIGMDYSPRCQWVDLYLNGSYAGLYLLSTSNEIHPQRVALSKENSFLVSMEMEARLEEQNLPYVKTENNSWLAFRIHDAYINRARLQEMLQSMENAILAEDGIDPVTGSAYQELIDVDSWAERYLIDEVFGNYDGGLFSQFFYYDGNSGSGKICAGPVWDMDNCLSLSGHLPNTIWAGREHLLESSDPSLFHALWEKEDFRQRVLSLYQEKFLPELENLLNGGLEEYAEVCRRSSYLNNTRWGNGDPAENAAQVRDFLEKRIDFLNAYYLGDTPYFLVEVSVPDDVWVCYAVPQGGHLEQYTQYGDTESGRYLGYYNYDTEEPFDVTGPIYSDAAIYPKWEPYEASGGDPETDEGFLPVRIAAPLAVLLVVFAAVLGLDLVNAGKNGGRKKWKEKSREHTVTN